MLAIAIRITKEGGFESLTPQQIQNIRAEVKNIMKNKIYIKDLVNEVVENIRPLISELYLSNHHHEN